VGLGWGNSGVGMSRACHEKIADETTGGAATGTVIIRRIHCAGNVVAIVVAMAIAIGVAAGVGTSRCHSRRASRRQASRSRRAGSFGIAAWRSLDRHCHNRQCLLGPQRLVEGELAMRRWCRHLALGATATSHNGGPMRRRVAPILS
jgi:hypothetical protein